MMERYFKLADIKRDQEKFLFRGLSRVSNGYRLRSSGGISYSRVRDLLLEKLKAVGLDPKQFGLHSLRSGGGLLQQPMQEYPTDGSRDMEDGNLRIPKTVTLTTRWRIDLECLKTLVCEMVALYCRLQVYRNFLCLAVRCLHSQLLFEYNYKLQLHGACILLRRDVFFVV